MAIVNSTAAANSKVYYGPSSTYVLRETFSTSKSVSVLERVGSYYLVQYSVTGGYVRGYIIGTSLSGNLSSVPSATNSINKFGLNIVGATANVYGGPDSSVYVSVGTISKREIITALKAEGSSWYHIEFYTASGLKRGYIQQSSIRVSSFIYDYAMPIRTGSRNWDYLNPADHVGIDIIVASGTPLYAITSGSAKYRTAYETDTIGRVTVSYGNYIEFTFNGNVAYYAHMSTFANGFTAPPYPNPSPYRGWSKYTKYIDHGSVTVSKDLLLGASGNSGNSSGPHLHFEVKDNGTTLADPFKYVLFAKMPS